MKRLSTAAGGRLMTASFGTMQGIQNQGIQLQEGEYTSAIYGLIKEEKYDDVIPILQNQLVLFPDNAAAISLLAYCFYNSDQFLDAAKWYEKLIELCPYDSRYKYYHAQSLYKAAMYQEAIKQAQSIENEDLQQDVDKLQAYCYYESDDLLKTKAHCDKVIKEDPDNLIIQGCIAFKENDMEEARNHFTEALVILEYQASIGYNVALCYYRSKQFTEAVKVIQEIIKRGIQDHPELSIASQMEGYTVRSVGNSKVLQSTALIEAFNLKFAIEYLMQNMEGAEDALNDMPPRTEEQLDAVTLHNQALLQMDTDATKGFKKLKHLIQNPPFPQETFANLLLLYCKYNYYSLAADVLAENSHLAFRYLSQDLYDFLEALIESQTSPEEAYRKFDILTNRHIDELRKLTKQMQDARLVQQSEKVKLLLKEFDEALSHYIPVLMAMGRIYWDIDNYVEVEKILMQSSEFCSQNDIWKLNMAHVCFMQETDQKFRAAIELYENIVQKQKHNLLEIPAMVLANLCVSYIMTNQNDEAEEWMKKIEQEEEQLQIQQEQNPNMKVVPSLHLCIVNLVIGTLYCSKGGIIHYEFGITRVIKSLEPYEKKIMPDTWFYAKRCFLALIETLAKHMIMIKDSTFQEVLKFLDAACLYGKDIETVTDYVSNNASGGDFQSMYESGFNPMKFNNILPKEQRNVRFEARLLKKMFLAIAAGEYDF